MPVRIVTDSTCDLTPETIAECRIAVIPLYIHIGLQAYLDGVDITRKEFYTRLPTLAAAPTTAVPSPQRFRAAYDALAEEGATEIVSIHVSGAFSAVVNVARNAATELPPAPVTVYDSGQLTLGTGFLVETAARMAMQGASAREIVAALDDRAKRTYVFAALDTLEFLRRSGRMNRFMAGIGALVKLKPIMTMHDGRPGAERVRTWERASQRMLEMLVGLGRLERAALVHANAPERAAALREHAAHLLPSGPIWSVDITPVIGAHIGPGAAGFAVVAA